MQVLTFYSRWKNNSIQKEQSQPMMPRSCSDPLRPPTAPRLHKQARTPAAPRLHGEARPLTAPRPHRQARPTAAPRLHGEARPLTAPRPHRQARLLTAPRLPNRQRLPQRRDHQTGNVLLSVNTFVQSGEQPNHEAPSFSGPPRPPTAPRLHRQATTNRTTSTRGSPTT